MQEQNEKIDSSLQMALKANLRISEFYFLQITQYNVLKYQILKKSPIIEAKVNICSARVKYVT